MTAFPNYLVPLTVYWAFGMMLAVCVTTFHPDKRTRLYACGAALMAIVEIAALAIFLVEAV